MSEGGSRGTRFQCVFSSQRLTLCALIGLAAPGAQASSSVRFGIQDDSWLVHGAGTLDERLDRLESLGVDVVRFNLHWDRIEPVRGKQHWEESDLVLEGLQDRGHPRRGGPRRLTALGERWQDAQLRAGCGRVRTNSRARRRTATAG